MRDRTKSRRYSPEAEQFRRDHARRRDWGLAQRHGLKLWRLRRERAATDLTAKAAATGLIAAAATPAASAEAAATELTTSGPARDDRAYDRRLPPSAPP